MADAEQSKMFQEIFGFDPSKKVSDQLRRIQRAVVLAELSEAAREVQPLRDKMAEVERRYADGAPIPSLDEAKSDLQEATELDEKLYTAEHNFQVSCNLVLICGFEVPSRIEYFFPPEEAQAK